MSVTLKQVHYVNDLGYASPLGWIVIDDEDRLTSHLAHVAGVFFFDIEDAFAHIRLIQKDQP